MDTKLERKKLSLQRETIRTLDTVELDGIHGGTWTAAVTASIRFCRHTDKVVKGAVVFGRAVKWAADHAPKGDPNNPPSVVEATA
jgi:hypothetical protein